MSTIWGITRQRGSNYLTSSSSCVFVSWLVLMSCVINKCNPSPARGSEIARIRHQMDQLPHCGGILVTKPRKLSSSWEKYHEGCHEYLLVIQSVKLFPVGGSVQCGPLSGFSVWLTWILVFLLRLDILHSPRDQWRWPAYLLATESSPVSISASM